MTADEIRIYTFYSFWVLGMSRDNIMSSEEKLMEYYTAYGLKYAVCSLTGTSHQRELNDRKWTRTYERAHFYTRSLKHEQWRCGKCNLNFM